MLRIARVVSSAVAAALLVVPVALPAGAHTLANDQKSTSQKSRERSDRIYWKERRQLERRARRQQGAPYRSGGTSPGGFDCSGFTRWVFAQEMELPHQSGAQFEMAKRSGFKRIWKRSKLNVGDLVFHDTGSGRIGHAGMYIGNGKFISSTSSSGVQVNSLSDGYWGPRWVGATRTPITQR